MRQRVALVALLLLTALVLAAAIEPSAWAVRGAEVAVRPAARRA